VGDLFSSGDRAGPGLAIARSFDRAQIPVKSGLRLPTAVDEVVEFRNGLAVRFPRPQLSTTSRVQGMTRNVAFGSIASV
jgi:hypothetical protein